MKQETINKQSQLINNLNLTSTPIYARDLKLENQNDAFMGVGFEDALKKAEDNDCDLIIGYFVKNNTWEED